MRTMLVPRSGLDLMILQLFVVCFIHDLARAEEFVPLF